MSELACIWEVRQRPEKVVIGRPVYLNFSIKNIGKISRTFWVNTKSDSPFQNRYMRVGLPPGRIFKWFTCNCGIFTGEPKQVELFVGVGSINNEPEDSYSCIIDDDSTVYYLAGDQIEPINYTLNITVKGEGAVQKNMSGNYFAKGTEIQLFAVRQLGWKFKQWNGSISSTSNPISIVMNDNMTIEAEYEKM